MKLNVLISDDGTPVLTDFGNAVLQQSTLQFTTTTMKYNISARWAVGTPSSRVKCKLT